LTGPRAPHGPHRIIDDLFVFGITSVPRAAALLGVTYAAARASVRKLIDAGILNPNCVSINGTRFYVATGIIDQIERPLWDDEAEIPEPAAFDEQILG
jgi:hypothetical protein